MLLSHVWDNELVIKEPIDWLDYSVLLITELENRNHSSVPLLAETSLDLFSAVDTLRWTLSESQYKEVSDCFSDQSMISWDIERKTSIFLRFQSFSSFHFSIAFSGN